MGDTRRFKDMQDVEWTLIDCVELDENTVLGTVLGTGANKIFGKDFEITEDENVDDKPEMDV